MGRGRVPSPTALTFNTHVAVFTYIHTWAAKKIIKYTPRYIIIMCEGPESGELSRCSRDGSSSRRTRVPLDICLRPCLAVMSSGLSSVSIQLSTVMMELLWLWTIVILRLFGLVFFFRAPTVRSVGYSRSGRFRRESACLYFWLRCVLKKSKVSNKQLDVFQMDPREDLFNAHGYCVRLSHTLAQKLSSTQWKVITPSLISFISITAAITFFSVSSGSFLLSWASIHPDPPRIFLSSRSVRISAALLGTSFRENE